MKAKKGNTDRKEFAYGIRKVITAILIFISFSSYAQTSANLKTVVDSAAIKQAALNKAVEEIVTKTSIKEFQQWLYENISAKAYDESRFANYYNAFIEHKYKSAPKK